MRPHRRCGRTTCELILSGDGRNYSTLDVLSHEVISFIAATPSFLVSAPHRRQIFVVLAVTAPDNAAVCQSFPASLPARLRMRSSDRVQCLRTEESFRMARNRTNAPKQITWIICLILYVVALLAHFRVVHVPGDVAEWSWIIGYGLLLLAVQMRGL